MSHKSPVRFSTTPLASLAGLNKQVKMPKMAFYILLENNPDLHFIVGSIELIFKLGKIGKKLAWISQKVAKMQENSQKTQKKTAENWKDMVKI